MPAVSDEEAWLIRFLHEMGYKFVGPASLYRLTRTEINALVQGQRLWKEGIEQGQKDRAVDSKMDEYAKKHNL